MDDSRICLEERSKEQERLVDEKEAEVLPGFRFHPTDEELVGFYLRRKVEKKNPISIDIIKQIDIYKYDPWELPKLSNIGEKEWYFFCLRGRKYRNSIRPNRVTGSGFWKATGIDRPIHSSSNNSGDCIGLKKSLVYYRGSAGKGTKTDWMMHEFRLPSSHKAYNNTPIHINEAESWTICRIFKRNVSFKKYTQQISWKEAVGDGGGGESSSKTSSLECDSGEEHKYLQGQTSFLQRESHPVNCMEENRELYGAGQWNPNATASISTLQPNIKEIFKGDWDEIGRMVDYYMMEPVTTYDCIYY